MRSQEQLRQPYRQNIDSTGSQEPPAQPDYAPEWASNWPSASLGGGAGPTFTEAPGISPEEAAGDTEFTISLGEVEGYPEPVVTWTLFLDDTDVTAEVVEGAYTPPAEGGELVLTVTATNVVSTTVATAEATATDAS